jgi:hypothetical protein
MATFIVTFDLKNASSTDYDTAAANLRRVGLVPLTPNATLLLPMNTFSGAVLSTAADLRDSIRASFAASNLHVVSLFVGEVADWAAWGNRARAA